jgi:hypothetical protein
MVRIFSRLSSVFAAVVAASLALPVTAEATTVIVSEPGTMSLLALGVAAAAIVALRKRRK